MVISLLALGQQFGSRLGVSYESVSSLRVLLLSTRSLNNDHTLLSSNSLIPVVCQSHNPVEIIKAPFKFLKGIRLFHRNSR